MSRWDSAFDLHSMSDEQSARCQSNASLIHFCILSHHARVITHARIVGVAWDKHDWAGLEEMTPWFVVRIEKVSDVAVRPSF